MLISNVCGSRSASLSTFVQLIKVFKQIKAWLRVLPIILVTTSLWPAPALAQISNNAEFIVNGGFANGSFSSWGRVAGAYENIVQASSNPNNNAPTNDDGGDDYYLDANSGAGTYFNEFAVPACDSSTITVTIRGAFSPRDGSQTGNVYIELREGGDGTGAQVTNSRASINVPYSDPQPWESVSASVTVNTGATYSFVAHLSDPANFDTASVVATSSCGAVQPVNPTAGHDTLTATSPLSNGTVYTQGNVFANDTAGDSAIVTSSARFADNGTASSGPTYTNADGDFAIASNGEFSFTPSANFNGSSVSIDYTVADQEGDRSNEATITLNFPANSGPTVGNDQRLNNTSASNVTVNVVANDSDSDGLDNSSIQINGTTQPGDSLTVSGQGIWSVNSGTGEITFTPTSGFTGNPTPINYTIADTLGARSTQSATVTITYQAPTQTNTPPVADDELNTPTAFNTFVDINVLVGDTDVDPHTTLTIDSFNTPPVAQGTVTNQGGGILRFTPANGFTGTTDEFTYTVFDGNGGRDTGRVSVVVAAPLNTPPVADHELDIPASFGEFVDIDVLDGDNDHDGNTLSVQILTQPPASEGVVTNLGGGVLRFTPAPGFIGTTSEFTYTLSDGNGGSDVGRISVVVSQSASTYSVTKTARSQTARPGDYVAYIITLANNSNAAGTGLDIVDEVPLGLAYSAGTAQIDGTPIEPTIIGQDLIWENVTIPANGSVDVSLLFKVGQNVRSGDILTNAAFARQSGAATLLSNRGLANLIIQADEIFDCSAVVGKVFNDLNQNGMQNAGEAGIAGARLITTSGLIITTDSEGRYHVPCASTPAVGQGSNFIVKLDPQSLPLGYSITTENPRVVRLTEGKMGEASFGVFTPLTFELSVETYDNPADIVLNAMSQDIDATIKALLGQKAMLRLIVIGNTDNQMILNALESELRQRWQSAGAPYSIDIMHHAIQPVQTKRIHPNRR